MSKAVAVRLGADLAESARDAAKVQDRSLAGQIEHWTKIGMAVEAVLPHGDILEIKRTAGMGLSEASDRLGEALKKLHEPTPYDEIRKELFRKHGVLYEHDEKTGQVIQVQSDGRRVPGKISGRKFIPSG